MDYDKPPLFLSLPYISVYARFVPRRGVLSPTNYIKYIRYDTLGLEYLNGSMEFVSSVRDYYKKIGDRLPHYGDIQKTWGFFGEQTKNYYYFTSARDQETKVGVMGSGSYFLSLGKEIPTFIVSLIYEDLGIIYFLIPTQAFQDTSKPKTRAEHSRLDWVLWYDGLLCGWAEASSNALTK